MRTSSSRTLRSGADTNRLSTWLGGHIPALYPYADIYPLFIADNVGRVDGVAFEPPVTSGAQFLDRLALQVSRRNNHTQHYPQTALAKFDQGAALSGRTPMIVGDCDILVTSRDHQKIMEHLFPGDQDEHGAILRAGIVRDGSSLRLLIQDVHPARVWYGLRPPDGMATEP